MNRIKRKTVGTYLLTATAETEEGVAEVISAPATVQILDGAGVSVVEDTPTITQAGTLTYAADAALMPKFDVYTVIWTGVVDGESQSWVTDFELVGGYLFEIADLRSMDRAFQDLTKYPADYLRQVRTMVEDAIEGPRAAQRAFVPRGRRCKVNGSSPDLTRAYSPLMYGTDYRGLLTPDFDLRELYACTIDGTPLTIDEINAITLDDNHLWRGGGVQWPAWPFGHSNISLHYTFGLDRAPAPISRAALILAREFLVTSPIPGRATAQAIGDTIFRLTIAGRDGIFGLPDVDSAIDQWGRKGYGIG